MNYDFCEELDTPEIMVILNKHWWYANAADITEWFKQSSATAFGNNSMMLFIPEPADRTYFMLRWPQ